MTRSVSGRSGGVTLLLATTLLVSSFLGQDGPLLLAFRVTIGSLLVLVAGVAWITSRDRVPTMAPPPAGSAAPPRRFVLFQCIEDARTDLGPLAEEKGVRLQVEYLTSMPVTVLGNVDAFRAALAEVLRAAIHATRKGTVLLLVYCWREGGAMRLELVVLDAGSGLAPAALREMFRNWDSVDAARDHRRIEQARASLRRAGGALDVRHWPGVGSVFRLEVPAGPDRDVPFFEPPGRPEPEPEPLSPLEGADATLDLAGLHVLVIDDKSVSRRVLEGLLLRWNAAVTLAQSGTEAIGRFENGSWSLDTFDAVLTNLEMPGLDGFETVGRLRHLGYVRPVVAVTAAVLPGGRSTCVEAGFDDYLPKPVDPGRLGVVLRGLLREGPAARPVPPPGD